MYEDGYTQIMNVDYSLVAIKSMQEKYREKVGECNMCRLFYYS